MAPPPPREPSRMPVRPTCGARHVFRRRAGRVPQDVPRRRPRGGDSHVWRHVRRPSWWRTPDRVGGSAGRQLVDVRVTGPRRSSAVDGVTPAPRALRGRPRSASSNARPSRQRRDELMRRRIVSIPMHGSPRTRRRRVEVTSRCWRRCGGSWDGDGAGASAAAAGARRSRPPRKGRQPRRHQRRPGPPETPESDGRRGPEDEARVIWIRPS